MRKLIEETIQRLVRGFNATDVEMPPKQAKFDKSLFNIT